LRAVGSVNCCMAPGNYTYSSHAAMFMGFTPGDANHGDPLSTRWSGKYSR